MTLKLYNLPFGSVTINEQEVVVTVAKKEFTRTDFHYPHVEITYILPMTQQQEHEQSIHFHYEKPPSVRSMMKVKDEDQLVKMGLVKAILEEAVAYSMMTHLGFDTSAYSLGYIATWAKSPETMKQALKEIRETLQQTITIVDRLTYPRLSQNLAQKVNETSQSYSVLLSQAQLRVYLPAIVELHNVTAIEAYDRTTNSIALLKYHPVAKMLFDDQGMLVKTDRLEQRNVLLLNVLDTTDQAKKHFKRFNEQFTLQDGNDGIKLTHDDTGTVIATYADLAEGKHKVNQLITQEGVLKRREMGVELGNTMDIHL